MPNDTTLNWRLVFRTLAAGVVASLVMIGFLYLLPMFGAPRLNIFMLLSTISSDYSWWAEPLEYAVLGIVVFPLIYRVMLLPNLPGSTGWQKGLVWGVILWLLRGLVVAPVMGEGLFSIDSAHSIAVVLFTFIAHLLYGLVLGLLATPRMRARPVGRASKREYAQRT